MGMSLFDFLKPPMFQTPESLYLPLAQFPASDATQQRSDFDTAIAQLNQKAKDFSSNPVFTRKHVELITDAEAHANQQQWAEAYQAVWEATFGVNRALESRGASKFRKWMVVYYAVWIALLLGLGSSLKARETDGELEGILGGAYWRFGFMGAIGGLTVAIWGLTRHTADLDFDRSFAIWYFLKPVLGAIMGVVAVLAVLAGLFAVQGNSDIQSRTALCILAFLAGFSERFFIRIIDRVMTSLLGGDGSGASAATPARASARSRTPRGNPSNPGGTK
jgi:hypothetical protein